MLAFVDTETTGFSNTSEIVEIAIVVADMYCEIESEYETIVMPKRPEDCGFGAREVNGFDEKDWEEWGAPDFSEIADDVFEINEGKTLVAHNAAFDIRMLNNEMTRLGFPPTPAERIVCTQKMARKQLKPQGVTKFKLDLLCDHFGIPNTNNHTAMQDALRMIRLYRHLKGLV